jgi:transcriptional regulator with AAA-type ATPase domain
MCKRPLSRFFRREAQRLNHDLALDGEIVSQLMRETLEGNVGGKKAHPPVIGRAANPLLCVKDRYHVRQMSRRWRKAFIHHFFRREAQRLNHDLALDGEIVSQLMRETLVRQ